MLKSKDGKIIFCGHSLGGGVAGITSLLAVRYIKKGLEIEDKSVLERILTITIGSPLFADDKARKHWKEKGRLEFQYHIVSNSKCDLVPPLLTLKSLDQLINAAKEESWILNAIGVDWVLWFGKAKNKELASMAQDCLKYIRNEQPKYKCLGNFYFIGDKVEKCKEKLPCSLEEYDELDERLGEMTQLVIHSVKEVDDRETKMKIILQGHCKHEYKKKVNNRFGESISNHNQSCNISDELNPTVEYAALNMKSQINGSMELRLKGKNLFGIVKNKCEFNFGFKIDLNLDEQPLEHSDRYNILLTFQVVNDVEEEAMNYIFDRQLKIVTDFGETTFKLNEVKNRPSFQGEQGVSENNASWRRRFFPFLST